MAPGDAVSLGSLHHGAAGWDLLPSDTRWHPDTGGGFHSLPTDTRGHGGQKGEQWPWGTTPRCGGTVPSPGRLPAPRMCRHRYGHRNAPASCPLCLGFLSADIKAFPVALPRSEGWPEECFHPRAALAVTSSGDFLPPAAVHGPQAVPAVRDRGGSRSHAATR